MDMELDPQEIMAEAETFLRSMRQHPVTLEQDDIHLPGSLEEALKMVRVIEDENGDICKRFRETLRYLESLLKLSRGAYEKCPCANHAAMQQNLVLTFIALTDSHKAYHILEYAITMHLEKQ